MPKITDSYRMNQLGHVEMRIARCRVTNDLYSAPRSVNGLPIGGQSCASSKKSATEGSSPYPPGLEIDEANAAGKSEGTV